MSPANFKDIVLSYQKQVYNLALNYVQIPADAEEITQDVFLKVYEKIDQFEGNAQLKTWIYRITINTSLDFLKSKKFKLFKTFFGLSTDAQPAGNPLQKDSQHPGILLEQKEGLQRVLKAIDKLPAQQKTVLVLLKIEQLKQQEVAEIMDLSTKAVESLFQRAKKNLQQILNTTKENEK